jgi:hypothetical protein
MFPDASVSFLRTLLETQDPPQLDNAINQLLASPHYPKRGEKGPPGGLPSPSSQAISAHGQQQQPSPSGGGLLSSLRRQFTRPEPRAPSPLPPPPSLTPPVNAPTPSSTNSVQRPPGMTPGPQRPGAVPTSTDAIRANLTKAIQVRRLLLFLPSQTDHFSSPQASRPETASNVSNAVEQTKVKESEAYCDSTAA